MNKTKYLMVMIAVLLNGCTRNVSHHEIVRTNVNDSIINSIETNNRLKTKKSSMALPSKVSDLMKVHFGENLGLRKENIAIEPKFDIIVNEVEAKDFFLGLIKDTNCNVIVDKSVEGFVSLNMNNVTIKQVLEAVRDSYGYEYNITDYGYYIYGQKLISKVYNVNYINLSRHGLTTISGINASQVSDKGPVDGSSSNVVEVDKIVSTIQQEQPFWTALEANVKAIVGIKDSKNNFETEKSVVVNANTNTVVVRAYPYEQRLVEQYLKEVEEVLQRQVVIEAKIVEVELKDKFQTGIKWGVQFGRTLSDGTKAVNFNKNNVDTYGSDLLANNASIGSFSGVFGSFSASLDLLNAYGNVNVLSNPRITTLNNQKAVIKIGEENYYAIGVQDTSTSTATGTENRNKVELKVFFSGISLDVIPQIDKDDNIILHIHPAICEVAENKLSMKVANKDTQIPTARNKIKESDSVVRARNGEVIVIGGLMETYSKMYKDSIPVFDKIPLIGEAVKNRDQAAKKYEMVFLLKPTIVKKVEDWNQELKVISERVKKINKERFTYDFESSATRSNQYQVKSSKVVR